jgi:hypothetical protein
VSTSGVFISPSVASKLLMNAFVKIPFHHLLRLADFLDPSAILKTTAEENVAALPGTSRSSFSFSNPDTGFEPVRPASTLNCQK